MNKSLREKLLMMQAKDLQVRSELAATGELFDGYCPKMEKVHLENAAELERTIENIGGWPGKSLVGADGANAAWLIVQHAISLPDFLRKCLRLIEQAVAEGEAEPRQAAYLHDRICSFENRPQRYGTQSDWNEEGKMQVGKLEDEARVNEFRSEVGLPPLESLIWENEETLENKPADYAARQVEAQKWMQKVGWRK